MLRRDRAAEQDGFVPLLPRRPERGDEPLIEGSVMPRRAGVAAGISSSTAAASTSTCRLARRTLAFPGNCDPTGRGRLRTFG